MSKPVCDFFFRPTGLTNMKTFPAESHLSSRRNPGGRLAGGLLLAALLWSPSLHAQQPADRSVEKTARVIERGAHHAKWETVREVADPLTGKTVSVTNSYVQIEVGLHRLDEQGAWVEASDQIEIVNSEAVARNGQHTARWAANINTVGAIELTTPDGQMAKSHVLGLAFFDPATGDTLLIGQIKDSIGIVGGNQVTYEDAFDGVSADLRYTYMQAQTCDLDVSIETKQAETNRLRVGYIELLTPYSQPMQIYKTSVSVFERTITQMNYFPPPYSCYDVYTAKWVSNTTNTINVDNYVYQGCFDWDWVGSPSSVPGCYIDTTGSSYCGSPLGSIGYCAAPNFLASYADPFNTRLNNIWGALTNNYGFPKTESTDTVSELQESKWASSSGFSFSYLSRQGQNLMDPYTVSEFIGKLQSDVVGVNYPSTWSANGAASLYTGVPDEVCGSASKMRYRIRIEHTDKELTYKVRFQKITTARRPSRSTRTAGWCR